MKEARPRPSPRHQVLRRYPVCFQAGLERWGRVQCWPACSLWGASICFCHFRHRLQGHSMCPTAFLGFCPHINCQFVFPQKRVSSERIGGQKLTLCPCPGAGALASSSISDVLPPTQVLLPLPPPLLLRELRMSCLMARAGTVSPLFSVPPKHLHASLPTNSSLFLSPGYPLGSRTF